MRFYLLEISEDSSFSKTVKAWTSHPNGVYDPQAHNIEFDIQVAPFATPMGASWVTIEGVQLEDLTKYDSYKNWYLRLYAGFSSKGLPLMKDQPTPSLLFEGQILSGFGNWVGTEMTLTFFITAGVFSHDNPGNFSLSWKKGQQLSDALERCLSVAYPDKKIDINIPSFVPDHDEHGFYHSLAGLSLAIINLTGGAVFITIQAGVVKATGPNYDHTVDLNFNDMIGQPAWVDSDTLYVVTAMRGDVALGNGLKMPEVIREHPSPGFITTIPSVQNAYLPYSQIIQGTFTIKEVRHVGNFRSDQGSEWATVFKCVGSVA